MISFIIINVSDALVWTLNGSQVLPDTLAEYHEHCTELDLGTCVPLLDLSFQPARCLYTDSLTSRHNTQHTAQRVANSSPLVNEEESARASRDHGKAAASCPGSGITHKS